MDSNKKTMEQTERTKTQSKHFYDDEIKYVLPNGDIYLNEGVKRLSYPSDAPEDVPSINVEALLEDKKKQYQEMHGREDVEILEE